MNPTPKPKNRQMVLALEARLFEINPDMLDGTRLPEQCEIDRIPGLERTTSRLGWTIEAFRLIRPSELEFVLRTASRGMARGIMRDLLGRDPDGLSSVTLDTAGESINPPGSGMEEAGANRSGASRPTLGARSRSGIHSGRPGASRQVSPPALPPRAPRKGRAPKGKPRRAGNRPGPDGSAVGT